MCRGVSRGSCGVALICIFYPNIANIPDGQCRNGAKSHKAQQVRSAETVYVTYRPLFGSQQDTSTFIWTVSIKAYQ